ncbi:hypothetical protein G4G28_13045 [Massilia sp. Dwa41.01b]|uniref:hypothetical protein n=1 Tax=unclassified Massilia TaxID=2609279 RepID=UPI0016018D77|nr:MULTISPECIES: hypothetical protein [unclassified Massilia]QNA89162.1 hypothetical protein G4G28_13045 [Massilia sp. Dwa41.01b]QNB00058.1 hypothetical protein G4G31_16595 [Massilia sp. Se16.2.3]
MFKSSLRAYVAPAIASLLLAASATASAGEWVLEPLDVEGVLVEAVGPASRCLSQFGGTISGHGESKLMGGKVVFIATDCITPIPPLFNFSNGKFIVMTTSGDQIFANYSGQMVPTGEGTKYVFSGATFQITGGTGKFAKSTGGGLLTGGEDMATGTGTIKLSGRALYFKK